MTDEKSNGIYVVRSAAIQAEPFEREGAAKVKVQQLVGEHNDSKRAALRLYTIDKGGHTNPDRHEYEHQACVLRGEGLLRREGYDVPILSGDAVFIPSNALHEFLNQREEPLVYLLFNVF